MRPVIDLTGQKFGRLTVEEKVHPNTINKKNKHIYWRCRCDCGNETLVNGSSLRDGTTTSCGCVSRESASARCKKYNKYDLSGSYGVGYTHKDEQFFFDLSDFGLIKEYCWRLRSDGYLDAKIPKTDKRVLMHTLITGRKYVDHINGCGFDNRRCNLRIPDEQHCFSTYNQMNKCLQKNNTSGVAGVYKKGDKWVACINIDNNSIYLGTFELFDDAVEVRKNAEQKYFGEWSYDNSRKEEKCHEK